MGGDRPRPFQADGNLIELYLEPLAQLPALQPRIRYRTRVTAVTRKGFDKVRTQGRDAQPFILRIARPDGEEEVVEAKAVIDASGTWTSRNPAGADGLPTIGEVMRLTNHYGIPDVLGAAHERYAGKTVMVVGGGHSALNALIELATLRRDFPATAILWIMRKANSTPRSAAKPSHCRHEARSVSRAARWWKANRTGAFTFPHRSD